jgi:ElaB/YqjD/DUF883 family membrane-anchored ribosome-binding protein
MNDDAKLEQIRQRVDQASTRNARRLAERAGEARDSAAAFVAEHPLATVAGGIAVGALIAAVLPRRSKRDKAGAKATAKPAAWIGILAQAGLAIAERSVKSARKARRAGQRSLEHLGDRVSDGTAGLRKEIGRFAEETAGNVRNAGQQASQQARSVTEKIGSHLRH